MASSPARRLLVPAGMVLVCFSPSVQAICNSNILPILQCESTAWFAPPPAGTGAVGTIWWQISYGNNRVNNGCYPDPFGEGRGICPPGVFSGMDSGLFPNFYQTTPADAAHPDLAAQIPDGSFCMNGWSWAQLGVEGCADDERTSSRYDNDNLLNPYWGWKYGPCPVDDCPYETSNYQIDYPMAVLARESTNRFFAVAFTASRTRHGDSTDTSEGAFDFGEIVNGDENPVSTRRNIIPWQPVPRPRVLSVTESSPESDARLVSFRWENIRLVHDASTRPNARVVAGGVGILDQMAQPGGLCRYQIQSAPLQAVPMDPTTLMWKNEGDAIPCLSGEGALYTQVTVPYGTAIRIRTLLGKQPRTTSTILANTRVGACGDLGFEATDCRADNCMNGPPFVLFAGPELVVDTVAERNRNAVLVSFRTTSELTVTGIDLLGRGDAVVASVACKQCTNGVGDSYEVLLTPGDLKGARALRARLNGPDAVSEPFPIR